MQIWSQNASQIINFWEIENKEMFKREVFSAISKYENELIQIWIINTKDIDYEKVSKAREKFYQDILKWISLYKI